MRHYRGDPPTHILVFAQRPKNIVTLRQTWQLTQLKFIFHPKNSVFGPSFNNFFLCGNKSAILGTPLPLGGQIPQTRF